MEEPGFLLHDAFGLCAEHSRREDFGDLEPCVGLAGVVGGEAVASRVAFEPGVLFEVEVDCCACDRGASLDGDEEPLLTRDPVPVFLGLLNFINHRAGVDARLELLAFVNAPSDQDRQAQEGGLAQ